MPQSATETRPIIDRSAARAEIKARLDEAARAKGFADYATELDDDYAQWQQRARRNAVQS